MTTDRNCDNCGRPTGEHEDLGARADVGLCDDCSGNAVETPSERPIKFDRRAQLIALAATAVTIGIGLAFAVTRGGPSSSDSTGGGSGGAASGSRRTLDHQVNVRGYSKQQAYGPDWSLRRPREIAPHVRGPQTNV